jgi:hypothetical protein
MYSELRISDGWARKQMADDDENNSSNERKNADLNQKSVNLGYTSTQDVSLWLKLPSSG